MICGTIAIETQKPVKSTPKSRNYLLLQQLLLLLLLLLSRFDLLLQLQLLLLVGRHHGLDVEYGRLVDLASRVHEHHSKKRWKFNGLETTTQEIIKQKTYFPPVVTTCCICCGWPIFA